MEDRAVLYPGRVKLVPVDGQENVYDMERADEPLTKGTPLNKATLLQDTTAALYGMTAEAVPDDVFGKLSCVYQHCWKRYSKVTGYKATAGDIVGTIKVAYQGDRTIQYGTTLNVSDAGVITLANPTSINITCNGDQYTAQWNPLVGTYCTNLYQDSSKVYTSSDVFTGRTMGDGAKVVEMTNAKPIVATSYEGWSETFDYVFSPDKSTYPENDVQGNYLYEYVGIPFDNMPVALRSQAGSYIGNGTYGSANKNSLTFDFVPKLLIVMPADSTVGIRMVALNGTTTVASASPGYDTTYSVNIDWSGHTVSWYGTSQAQYQLNGNEKTYLYMAIG